MNNKKAASQFGRINAHRFVPGAAEPVTGLYNRDYALIYAANDQQSMRRGYSPDAGS